MKRRDFITLLSGAAAWPLAARAQQAEPVRRVGVLIGATKDSPGIQSLVATLTETLAMLGWIEGGNLRMDYRFIGDPDRVAAYAEALVNLRPDLILALGGPMARAVQQRTSVIPTVFVAADPAQNGLVANIARPGGNMTGFAGTFVSLGGKWLELFKEAIPGLTRVAHVFSANQSIANPRNEFRTIMDVAAARLGVTIVTMAFRDAAEIEPAISAFAAAPNGGLLATGAVAPAHLDAIERLALHYRLPLMRQGRPEEGVLISHGPDRLEGTRLVASYVDRILRGAKPGDLPVQFPTKFELAVNLKTAKAIGVTIPESFLSLADEVIE